MNKEIKDCCVICPLYSWQWNQSIYLVSSITSIGVPSSYSCLHHGFSLAPHQNGSNQLVSFAFFDSFWTTFALRSCSLMENSYVSGNFIAIPAPFDPQKSDWLLYIERFENFLHINFVGGEERKSRFLLAFIPDNIYSLLRDKVYPRSTISAVSRGRG